MVPQETERIEYARALHVMVLTVIICQVCDLEFRGENNTKVVGNWAAHNAPCKERFEAWVQTRDKVLKRDNNQCTSCGRRDDLHVHHIHPKSKGGENNPLNLVTLCRKCHSKAHGREIHIMHVSSSAKAIFKIFSQMQEEVCYTSEEEPALQGVPQAQS